MYIEIKEVIETTEILNDAWWHDIDVLPDRFYPFEVRACGGEMAVYFLGEAIWCSEDDPRNYNEEDDIYEPLEGFLRQEVRRIANDILETIAER